MPNPVQALREPQGLSPAKTWAAPKAAAALACRVARRSCRRRSPGLALTAALLVLLGALLGAGGCKSSSQTTIRPLCIAGSTSVQPFAEKLAEIYMHQHPGVRIDVQGGGSSAGIQAALSGAAQIGMSSRELKDDEKKLTEYVIAKDAIAVVVNPKNPVLQITVEQVKAIFSGRIVNWKDLGGPDRPITVISREEGSGTRGSFEELVMGETEVSPRALVQDSNGAVRETVAGDRWAIGYISLGLVDSRVRPLPLSGVEPTVANVLSGKYPLVRPFLFLSNGEPKGEAKAFIEYVMGPKGQTTLMGQGLVPTGKTEGGK